MKHNWETMKTAVNNYIGSLNWGYRVALRDKNVNYVNAYAEFIEPHKIKVILHILSFIYRLSVLTEITILTVCKTNEAKNS